MVLGPSFVLISQAFPFLVFQPPPFWTTSYSNCKTQNSGLRSKEEKPRDPINQHSRCNTQEGLLSVAQTGDSDLLGGRAHRTANWASFLQAKTHTISILHTGYKVIGYTFAKQSYWYKLRGLLFKLKAILLVQTVRAFFQTQAPLGFSALPRAFTGCILIGWLQVTRWGAGNPTISRETETQVQAACQPQPRQPHIIKLISQLQKPTRRITDT